MSNIIYDDKIYNEEIKQEYLDDGLSKGNQKIMLRIFKVSYQMEHDLGKDLCNFSREELRRLGYLFMPSTPNASKGNMLYISNYIDWAIENQYATGINPLDGTSTEWKEQFVVAPQKRFWTDKELREIEDKLANAQDSCVLTLLRYGVFGTEMAEIVKLRKRDIDSENNVLTLHDKNGSSRKITVDDYCIAQCERALRQSEYLKKNGEPSADTKSESVDLVANDYVIKSSLTRTDRYEEADNHLIYRRLETISEAYNEKGLTPTSVFHSGMIAYGANQIRENGKLNYEEIAERFNVSAAVINRLKGDFLHEEFIKEMYDLKS